MDEPEVSTPVVIYAGAGLQFRLRVISDAIVQDMFHRICHPSIRYEVFDRAINSASYHFFLTEDLDNITPGVPVDKLIRQNVQSTALVQWLTIAHDDAQKRGVPTNSIELVALRLTDHNQYVFFFRAETHPAIEYLDLLFREVYQDVVTEAWASLETQASKLLRMGASLDDVETCIRTAAVVGPVHDS